VIRYVLANLALLFTIFVSHSVAASCTAINVAPNASLCLQSEWRPIVGGTLTTLDAFGSGGHISEGTTLSFAANLYDTNGAVAAMMNVRRYPTETISQGDIAEITGTSDEIQELVSLVDRSARDALKEELPKQGIKLLGWLGTKLDRLDAKTVFVTTYRRLSNHTQAVFVVRLVRIFDASRSFTLTLSHREDLGGDILNIMNGIQQSMRIR
jgi:hypothetical protein